MHNAPAVSYPVGRSRFHGWILLAAGLAGLASSTAWGLACAAVGWRQALAFALLFLASLNAFWRWRQTPAGVLRWDGQLWHLELARSLPRTPVDAGANLSIQLDFQVVMLARLHFENGARLWLWLQAQGDVAHWQALRRAAHGRVSHERVSHAGAAASPAQTPAGRGGAL